MNYPYGLNLFCSSNWTYNIYSGHKSPYIDCQLNSSYIGIWRCADMFSTLISGDVTSHPRTSLYGISRSLINSRSESRHKFTSSACNQHDSTIPVPIPCIAYGTPKIDHPGNTGKGYQTMAPPPWDCRKLPREWNGSNSQCFLSILLHYRFSCRHWLVKCPGVRLGYGW